MAPSTCLAQGKRLWKGSHPVSLEAPLQSVISTPEELAALSIHGTDGRLFIILPVGKVSHNVP